MSSVLTSALHNILQAILPTSCAACGQVLVNGEQQICVHCMAALPTTQYSAARDNNVERLLYGRFPFANATAIYHYSHGNTAQQVVHAMKFHGNSDLCLLMGRQMGLDLLRSARFDDVDTLVPVPLHWWRRLRRGYNQSELLCRGIAKVMPRPIDTTTLVRHRYTRQQSLQHATQRQENVADAFSLHHPEQLAGHHVLLVDDVLTTGATLASCCSTLQTIPNITISIATLTVAGH